MEKNLNKHAPLSYDICGIKLNIYDPRWHPRTVTEPPAVEIPARWRTHHFHFTYEAFFVVDGSLSIATEQGTAVYKRKIVILPPKLRHASFSQDIWGVCVLFGFDPRQEEKDPRIRKITQRLNSGICTLPVNENTQLYTRKAMENAKSSAPVSQKEADLLKGLLFCQVIQQLLPEDSQSQPVKSKDTHINAIESYINANRYRQITPTDIAENVFLSVRQVSRIIQKEYHCTPRQLIMEKKLSAAETLLKNTDIKVSQIAAMVNLGADNYFYALFKKRYGKTPLQYRKEKGRVAK